jgi:glutamate carboxypeptidase
MSIAAEPAAPEAGHSAQPAAVPSRPDLPEAIVFLRELVAIESPSGDTAASGRIATLIGERCEALGGRVQYLPTAAGTNLVADFAQTGEQAGPPLLLVGHTDTVWPRGTLDAQIPWRVEGDTIAGPGVFDMKAGIVVMLAALERAAERPHRAVRIILTCDEEVGSPTTSPLLRELGSTALAAMGFESPHPDGALKVGRRGSVRVRITVTGRSAHAALDPGLGVSAIDELVDQLITVRDIVAGSDPNMAVLCNVGTIHGGTRANVIPDQAEAEIGLRFVDPQSEARVLARLAGLTALRAGASIEVTQLSGRPAWLPSTADQALLDAVSLVAVGIGQSLSGRPATGAGDTNLLGSLGVPTLDGFGPRGGGAHSVSEHVSITSLWQRIELVTAILAGTALFVPQYDIFVNQ